MRNWDTPYLTDWFAISFRWIIVLGLTIALGLSGKINEWLAATLALPLLWNCYVSLLAIFYLRIGHHRLVNLSIDLLFSLAIFFLSGGINSPLIWIFVLPAAIAALYYEWRGAALATLLICLIEAAWTYFFVGANLLYFPLLLILVYNLVGAAIISLLAIPLLAYLRRIYQKRVIERKEADQRVQRQERERMQALFQMVEAFSSTLNYQNVLEIALDTGLQAIGHDKEEEIAAAVLLFGENGLELKTARRFYQRDWGAQLPAREGLLNEVLKEGAYRLLTEPAKDPELNAFSTLENSQSVVCLPLMRGLTQYGVLLFAHPQPDFFTKDRLELLDMIANQAVIAIQNAGLYQDLASEKERIVQSQEEAQKKLARDLHDGPTQSISAIAMRIGIARKLLTRSVKEADDELMRIEDLARRTTNEIRHMLFTLRPLVMETEGLTAALQTMAEKMNQLYQQNVQIVVEPSIADRLDSTRQTVVFYLAEEAANNARKHAKAASIWVRLHASTEDADVAMLEIIDNGLGFNVAEVMNNYERRGSLGMVNLRERTDQVSGTLKVESVPGKGTRILALIPITAAAADRLQQSKS